MKHQKYSAASTCCAPSKISCINGKKVFIYDYAYGDPSEITEFDKEQSAPKREKCKLTLFNMPNKEIKGSDLEDLSPEMRQLVNNRVHPLSVTNEMRLIDDAQKGSETAKHQLIKAYARYILKAALYYAPYAKLPIDECFAISLAGFNKAIDTFIPTKGARLGTRVQQVLTNCFQRAIDKEKDNRDYHLSLDDFYQEPSNSSYNDEDNYSVDLYSPAYDSFYYEGSDKLAVHENLYAAIGQLPPRERDIILGHLDGLTYEEMADTLGISTARVGQIYKRALALLRAGKNNFDV